MTDKAKDKTAAVSDAKKFERPNKEALDKTLAAIDEKIKEQKAVVDAVNATLDSVSKDKDKKAAPAEGAPEKKYSPEQTRLNQIRDEIKKLFAERGKLFEEMKTLKAERTRVDDTFADAKKRLKQTGCVSLDELNNKIRALDASLSTTAVSLKDEKAVVAQIKVLSASKKVFSEHDTLKAARDKVDASLKEISQKLDAIKVKQDELKAQEETLNAKILGMKESAKEKKQENRIDFPALMARRTAARAEIDKLYAEIKSLRSDFKKKDDEWRAFMNEKRKEQKERQKADYEARKEQDKLRQLEREEEKFQNLHADKFASIDQLITYLKQFVETEDKAEEQAPVAKPEMPGFVAIGKHAQSFDDDVFGTKVDKSKGKSKKAKAPKKKGPIVHDLNCIVEFESLGVTAPLSADAIPGAIEALEKKRQDLIKDKATQQAKHEVKKAAILAGTAAAEEPASAAATTTTTDQPAAETPAATPAATPAP